MQPVNMHTYKKNIYINVCSSFRSAFDPEGTQVPDLARHLCSCEMTACLLWHDPCLHQPQSHCIDARKWHRFFHSDYRAVRKHACTEWPTRWTRRMCCSDSWRLNLMDRFFPRFGLRVLYLTWHLSPKDSHMPLRLNQKNNPKWLLQAIKVQSGSLNWNFHIMRKINNFIEQIRVLKLTEHLKLS